MSGIKFLAEDDHWHLAYDPQWMEIYSYLMICKSCKHMSWFFIYHHFDKCKNKTIPSTRLIKLKNMLDYLKDLK